MPDPGVQVLLWLLAAVLIAVGFAGLILPAVPGIPLVFAGLVLLAWAEDFAYVGWVTLALLGVLALLSTGVDFLAAALGAKKFGASPRAVGGAALGAVAGLFFGLPGIVLGAVCRGRHRRVQSPRLGHGGDPGGRRGDAGPAARRAAQNRPGLDHAGRV